MIWLRTLAGFIVAFALVQCTTLVVSAVAQEKLYRSYVTPFPQKDRYNLLVLGDSLGQGIGEGLAAALKKAENIDVINSARDSAGLSRRGASDLYALTDVSVVTGTTNIAVIMEGVNDFRIVKLATAGNKAKI